MMTKERAIKFANCLKNNYTINFNDMADFCDTAIKALEIVKEVKQIVDGWNDKITEPEEDYLYLIHIAELFEQD